MPTTFGAEKRDSFSRAAWKRRPVPTAARLALLGALLMPFGALAGPLISAGASLLGGAISGKMAGDRQEDAQDFTREFSAEQSRLNREQTDFWNQQQLDFARSESAKQGWQFDQQGARFRSAISDRVADARRAGLHPLFALGGGLSQSSGTSPVSFIPGQAASGSAISGTGGAYGADIGTGISRAGKAISDYFSTEKKLARQKDLDALNKRRVEASVSRDEAEALYYTAQAKRVEQRALQGGSGSDAAASVSGSFEGLPVPSPEVETFKHPAQPRPSSLQTPLGRWHTNATSGGQSYEDRYQELGLIFSLLNLLDDTGSNIGIRAADAVAAMKRYKRSGLPKRRRKAPYRNMRFPSTL